MYFCLSKVIKNREHQITATFIRFQQDITTNMKTTSSLALLFSVVFNLLLISNVFPQPDPSSTLNQVDAKGRKQGYWVKKNTEGQLVYEGQFKDDHPYGEFKYYYPEGTARSTLKYLEDGKSAISVSFHPNGLKMAEGNYVDKVKDGAWIYYNDAGERASEEFYSKGIPVGIWKVYSGDKNVIEEFSYAGGLKEGSWKQYFPGGEVKAEANYVKGKLEGEAHYYYPDGSIMAKGSYVNGLKNGKWTNLKMDGKIESIFEYLNGEVIEETYLDKAKEEEFQKEEPVIKSN
jgi:antitoxin component YwqK of YwqJK toxin-antitoxin module